MRGRSKKEVMAHHWVRTARVGFCGLFFGSLLLYGVGEGSLTVSVADAVKIYSYIDDQGNPVYTDAPETIPEKYRAKVKTHEQPAPPTQTPSVVGSVQNTVREQMQKVGFSMPSFKLGEIQFSALSSTQSRILTYAGGIALVLLVIMYLSKNNLTRMLGFCLLILLGIGAPVLMYVSEDGPMDSMKKKASEVGQAQHNRLQQASP
ncbi:MAG: DUF4124 domain-containing protein [Nitrospiraceae bacterium]